MKTPDNHPTTSPLLGGTNVRIEVKNFGPIESSTVDLRPLTVFVGPSNTGKTYLAILIYALHRILDGFPRIPPTRGYIYHQFGSGKSPEIDVDTRDEDLRTFLARLEDDDREIRLSDILPKSARDAITIPLEHPELLQDLVKKEIMRCFDIDSVSELIRLPRSPNGTWLSLFVGEKSQNLWRFHMELSESSVVADGHVEDIILFPKGWQDPRPIHEMRSFIRSMIDRPPNSTRSERYPHFLVEDLFFEVGRERPVDSYYLPAARSGVMQSHRIIASSLVMRSTRAELERIPELPMLSGMMADFIQGLILYREGRPNDNPMRAIADLLEREALAGEIQTKRPLSGGHPEFMYRPRDAEQAIRLTRASSMVSELAPIVLFLRENIRRGDTLIIEEPEAHLHPAAQTQMAATLARLVRAGVRVVVTTHSDWLLKEIGNLMREGELGEKLGQSSSEEDLSNALHPSEVGVWLFRKNESSSGSIVEEIPFDLSEGIDPQDYEEVAEALYNRSADLQNRLEEQQEASGNDRG